MKFNLKVIINIVGILLIVNGILMLTCLPFSFYYGESSWYEITISSIINLITGCILYVLTRANKKEEKNIKKRDGYLIVTASWFFLSLFGMLPYFLSNQIPTFTNAFFESVSGYTTTGATILDDIDGSLDYGLMYWRSLTQYMGGMGIIVLAVAILPFLGIGGMQLFVAEAPGISPDKLRPRIKETAKRLWIIYLSFTIILFFILFAEGMTFFDAVNHAMTTMATGGFSTKNESIGYFDSPTIQYTIIFFMALSATNFTLIYFGLKFQFRKIIENEEFKFYIAFLVILTLIVFSTLYTIDSTDVEKTFRTALFNVVAILTTTGYASADFTSWNTFMTILFFLLMFFGATAGSTSGGVKLIRHMILLKNSFSELKKQLHPSAIIPVRINNSVVTRDVILNIQAFIILYIFLFSIGTILMSLTGVDFITAVGSAGSAIGNVGPGIGDVGPAETYSSIPTTGKYILCVLMFLGRLELFTVLLILTPFFWRDH